VTAPPDHARDHAPGQGQRQRQRQDDSGAVAVLVAVLMATLLGVVALVVDVGLARDQVRQTQAAVDSAALAAAIVMHESDGTDVAAARHAATQYLLANYDPPVERAQFTADWAACTGCVTFSDTKVTVSLAPLPGQDVSSPAVFGGIYGVSDYRTAMAATATWSDPLAGDCLLCVVQDADFDDDPHGVGVVETGNAKIGGGLDIHSPGALTVHGGDVLRGSAMHGQPTVDSGHQILPLTTFADPYAAAPAHDPWAVLGSPSEIPPAQYDEVSSRCRPPVGSPVASITAADATTCPAFDPGMYVIYPGWNQIVPAGAPSAYAVTPMGGGTGVLFFLTCRSGSAPARCSSPNSGGAYLDRIGTSLTLKGITSTSGTLAPFRGFAIIVDADNAGSWFSGSDRHTLGSTLNGDLVVHGNVYLPGQNLIANDRTTVYGQVVVGGNLTVGTGHACSSACLTVKAPTLVAPPVPPRKVRLLPGT
jgi:Flp pilus assembly protein TadG